MCCDLLFGLLGGATWVCWVVARGENIHVAGLCILKLLQVTLLVKREICLLLAVYLGNTIFNILGDSSSPKIIHVVE